MVVVVIVMSVLYVGMMMIGMFVVIGMRSCFGSFVIRIDCGVVWKDVLLFVVWFGC